MTISNTPLTQNKNNLEKDVIQILKTTKIVLTKTTYISITVLKQNNTTTELHINNIYQPLKQFNCIPKLSN